MRPAPQDVQLMSKHRVLSLKPQLRLEWRGQDGQYETEQPDHSASLGDSIAVSTQIRFSVPTTVGAIRWFVVVFLKCDAVPHIARNASEALETFGRHTEKTFSTLSVKNGPRRTSELSQFIS